MGWGVRSPEISKERTLLAPLGWWDKEEELFPVPREGMLPVLGRHKLASPFLPLSRPHLARILGDAAYGGWPLPEAKRECEAHTPPQPR